MSTGLPYTWAYPTLAGRCGARGHCERCIYRARGRCGRCAYRARGRYGRCIDRCEDRPTYPILHSFLQELQKDFEVKKLVGFGKKRYWGKMITAGGKKKKNFLLPPFIVSQIRF
jgi:hypothetical protein